MCVATVETKFWWELGEAVMRIHFDPVIFTATLIRWLESATIGWASEGDELVEAVAKTTQGAVGAIDSAVGVSGFAAVLLVLANDLFRDLDGSVNDVAERAAELTCCGVGRGWRCLDVGGNKAAQGGKGGSDDEEFFHA